MRSRYTRNSHRVGQYFENLEERLAFSATPGPITTTMPIDSSMNVNYAQVATGIHYNAQTDTLNIYGTSGDDKVEISQSSSQVDINTPPIVVTHVSLGKYEMVDGERTFVVTDSQVVLQNVNHVSFWGYDGNDEFYNATSISSTAHGGAGDDLLVGGNGDDTLHGDGDNDKLYARGGNDLVNGGAGNDMLFAGVGSDALNGGTDNDVLVSIGGGTASLSGGAGVDSFWLDTTETVVDASSQEVAGGNIHQVAQFMSYSFDGGQTFTPVGKELTGGNLADPAAIYNEDNPVSLHLENFSDKPLFSANGPSQDDVFQGAVGDCYFMASLSAIADADPNYIQQMVVDLGDGTYAVRFYDQGQPVYVRVDADLYVTDSGDLRYADLGQGDSVWVAIVEKAYAYFRKMQGSYASIASGNGTLQSHLNLGKASWSVDDGITAEQIIAWHNSGSPSGAISDAVQAGALGLLNWMDAQLAAGQAVYTGGKSGIGNWTPLQVDDPATDGNESTFRRGQHIYMVDSVLKDGVGNITGVKLRDPYGSYRTLTDFTRIYFCLSAGAALLVSPFPGPIEMVDLDWEEESFIPLPGDPYVAQPSFEARIVKAMPRSTLQESNPTADGNRIVLAEEASKRTHESAVDAAFAKYWGLGGKTL